MLCDSCHETTASIHLQEVVKGLKQTVHLCISCAAKKKININSFETISVAEFLLNFSHSGQEMEFEHEHLIPVTCSECGLTSEGFMKSGRLGCSACYDAFKEILDDILPSMHHGGGNGSKLLKALGPTSNPELPPDEYLEKTKVKITVLQEHLSEAVGKEDFEKAAEIRDEIRNLKNCLTNLPVSNE